MSQSVNQRTLTSLGWRGGSSVLRVFILFGRYVVLGRLLTPDIFGSYAGTGAVVALTAVIAHFGFNGAFIHRHPETETEDEAAASHFTLNLITHSVWLILLLGIGTRLMQGDERTALIVIALCFFAQSLTYTARLILTRRVIHRRLALISTLGDIFSTISSITIAFLGGGIWALLSTNIANTVIIVALLLIITPVWKPKLRWSPPANRYFLTFGFKTMNAEALLTGLDRLDDLWTWLVLGSTANGFYRRAYTFATYPRKILATPINSVALGTYAELKEQREVLSKTFFRLNALLVRSGFMMGGLLALIAPEFIRIVIGPQWMPFLDAYRLMLIFTLLDPIKTTIADLFIAVGRPDTVIQIRVVQLIVMVIGLITLGRLDITGVAIAVDLMLVVGIALLLWQVREHIDFSLRKLFLVPTVALGIGMILARLSIELPNILGSDWRTGLIKTAVFLSVYGVILLTLEREQTRQVIRQLNSYLRPQLAKLRKSA